MTSSDLGAATAGAAAGAAGAGAVVGAAAAGACVGAGAEAGAAQPATMATSATQASTLDREAVFIFPPRKETPDVRKPAVVPGPAIYGGNLLVASRRPS